MINQVDFTVTSISMILGVIIAMELFFYIRINQYVHTMKGTALKAVAILSTSKISDHWKEKILPHYAVKIMVSSLKMANGLVLLLLSFCMVYGFGIACIGRFPEGFQRLSMLDMQAMVVGISLIYGLVRRKLNHA